MYLRSPLDLGTEFAGTRDRRRSFTREQEFRMYQTVHIAGHITAQGLFVCRLADGRIVIDLGDRHVTGRPLTR